MSAAEQQLDGCPLPAALVERTEASRKRAATCCRTGMMEEGSETTASSGAASLAWAFEVSH